MCGTYQVKGAKLQLQSFKALRNMYNHANAGMSNVAKRKTKSCISSWVNILYQLNADWKEESSYVDQ